MATPVIVDLAGNSSPDKGSPPATKEVESTNPAGVEARRESSQTNDVDARQTSAEAVVEANLTTGKVREEASDTANRDVG